MYLSTGKSNKIVYMLNEIFCLIDNKLKLKIFVL